MLGQKLMASNRQKYRQTDINTMAFLPTLVLGLLMDTSTISRLNYIGQQIINLRHSILYVSGGII